MLAKQSSIYSLSHLTVVQYLVEAARADCQSLYRMLLSATHSCDVLLQKKIRDFVDREEKSLQRYQSYADAWQWEPLTSRQSEWLMDLRQELQSFAEDLNRLYQGVWPTSATVHLT